MSGIPPQEGGCLASRGWMSGIPGGWMSGIPGIPGGWMSGIPDIPPPVSLPVSLPCAMSGIPGIDYVPFSRPRLSDRCNGGPDQLRLYKAFWTSFDRRGGESLRTPAHGFSKELLR